MNPNLPSRFFHFLYITLLFIFLLAQPGLSSVQASPTPPAPGPMTWEFQNVDVYNRVETVSDHYMVVDAQNRPHIAYGGNQLFYSWYDGADRHTEVADAATRTGDRASLVLDGSGSPRIVYLAIAGQYFKYAYKQNGQWVSEQAVPIGVAQMG